MTAFADYASYDALGLGELIAMKEVTATEVLEAAIARIEAENPRLNAVVHKMYDAGLAVAGGPLPDGPLAGVPYLMKDLYVQVAGHPTRNGSRLWADFVADHDFTLTERLKAAGLVLCGKTNTPEMGISATTEPRLAGPTRNPWSLGHSAGGSSGGSAAAVAAAMVPAAHATDGGGSIRIPASNCALFGLKPSRGRNPSGPDVGEGWSGMATGHAVTRSVRDSAALLDATHGPAPGDPYAAPAPAGPYLKEVGADPGRLRIAVTTTSLLGGAVDPACVAGAEAAAELCAELGHLVEPATPPVDADAIRWAAEVIIAGNLRNAIDLRLAALGREQAPDDVERITALWAERGARYTAADYARAVILIHMVGRGFGPFFETYDVLLTPTQAAPPLALGQYSTMGEDLDEYLAGLDINTPFTMPFNMSGGAAMSVPLHWTADGLPVGIQFGTRLGGEALLLRLATQLEQARPWWDKRPPG